MKKQIKKQFTLIELIIVIVVIGILAAMALPKFTGVIRNAHVGAMEQDLDIIEKAVIQYVMATDDGSYPFIDTNLDEVINEEDLYFKTNAIPQTLTDSLLKINGDDGSKIYKLDMDKLKPYINNLKYPDTEYVYSPNSDTAIDPIGRPDGDNNIHHIIGGGIGDNAANKKTISLIRNKNFSSSYGGTLYIGEDKEIYGSGNLKASTFENYTKITTNANAKKVVIGYSMSAFINENGEVYTMGYNNDKQLGRETNVISGTNFGLAELPTGIKAVDIVLTDTNMIVLGNDGGIYVCGYNICFNDKLSEPSYRIEKLTKIDLPNNQKAIEISDLDGCFVVVDDKGDIHIMGYNVVSSIGAVSREWNTYHFDNPIIHVATTEKNIIVVDEKGSLYGIGQNWNGELGLGDTQTKKEFTKIPLEENVVPKYLEGAQSEFLMLTTNNELYGWGLNNYGMFGISDDTQDRYLTPTKISYEGINSVSLIYSISSYCTQGFAFENEKGEVYGIGYNGSYQFGTGDTTSIITIPKKLTTTIPIKR